MTALATLTTHLKTAHLEAILLAHLEATMLAYLEAASSPHAPGCKGQSEGDARCRCERRYHLERARAAYARAHDAL